MSIDNFIVGTFFLILGIYGVFSTYRILKYQELYWAYPFIYQKGRKYSRTICNFVGIISIPFEVLILYLAIRLLFFSNWTIINVVLRQSGSNFA